VSAWQQVASTTFLSAFPAVGFSSPQQSVQAPPQPQIGGLVAGDYHAIGVRALDPGTTNQAALERALAAAKKIEVCPNNVLNVTMEVTGLR